MPPTTPTSTWASVAPGMRMRVAASNTEKSVFKGLFSILFILVDPRPSRPRGGGKESRKDRASYRRKSLSKIILHLDQRAPAPAQARTKIASLDLGLDVL